MKIILPSAVSGSRGPLQRTPDVLLQIVTPTATAIPESPRDRSVSEPSTAEPQAPTINITTLTKQLLDLDLQVRFQTDPIREQLEKISKAIVVLGATQDSIQKENITREKTFQHSLDMIHQQTVSGKELEDRQTEQHTTALKALWTSDLSALGEKMTLCFAGLTEPLRKNQALLEKLSQQITEMRIPIPPVPTAASVPTSTPTPVPIPTPAPTLSAPVESPTLKPPLPDYKPSFIAKLWASLNKPAF